MVFYKHGPDIMGNEFLFVSNDKIWVGDLKDGSSRVVVSNEGIINNARFSPDRNKIIFRSMRGKDGSLADLYMYDRVTGMVKRVTFLNGKSVPRRMFTDVAGWKGDVPIISTDAMSPFGALTFFYELDTETLNLNPLNLGPGSHILFHGDDVVIGRYTYDMPHWKGYKGGTRGVIWSGKLNGKFNKIVDLDGHVSSPCIHGEKVFFVSDHEGNGQIYSVDVKGGKLTKHSDFKTYYPRHLSSNGEVLLYSMGGELFTLNPEKKEEKKIEVRMDSGITFPSSKFPDTANYLEEYTMNGKDDTYGFVLRGKGIITSEEMSPQLQIQSHGRVRLMKFLDGKRVSYVRQDKDGEFLCISEISDITKHTQLKRNIGLIDNTFPSPDGKKIAVTNILFQLYMVNIENMSCDLIDESEAGKIRDVAWSNDSGKIAYTFPYMTGGFGQRDGSIVKTVVLDRMEKKEITERTANDYSPSFDPTGSYLYYLSDRTFDPVEDRATFNYSFPLMTRIYYMKIDGGDFSPTVRIPESMRLKSERESAGSFSDSLPIDSGNFNSLRAIKGGLLYLSYRPEGLLKNAAAGRQRAGKLVFFSFETKKPKTVAEKVLDFRVSVDEKSVLIRKEKNKVFKLQAKVAKEMVSGFDEEKEIHLKDLKIRIEPLEEWKQMFNETWLLATSFFWKEEFATKNARQIYEKYEPLVSKITTRFELSEIMREMQGEFRTSHSYETGGDFLSSDAIPIGHLGADFELRGKKYYIKKIYHGDLSNENEKSPLLLGGFMEGDQIVSINGESPGPDGKTIDEILLNLPSEIIRIDVKTQDKKAFSNYVKTIPDDRYLRYRSWVEENRKMVHEKTGGEVGYVHIPNMMLDGLAEFYRLYTREFKKFGLIVDVRFNGGGNVSQLVLEKLMRERIALTHPRRGQDSPYPSYSVEGPMIALTNENAGSDGDIFSHSFKLLSLGPLIGTRTWGGVIGISPERRLADGTQVTQPRFGMKFRDVGFGVENYGTDPTYEVEIKPEDWHSGKDPQMDLALSKIMEMIKLSEKKK